MINFQALYFVLPFDTIYSTSVNLKFLLCDLSAIWLILPLVFLPISVLDTNILANDFLAFGLLVWTAQTYLTCHLCFRMNDFLPLLFLPSWLSAERHSVERFSAIQSNIILPVDFLLFNIPPNETICFLIFLPKNVLPLVFVSTFQPIKHISCLIFF